MKPARTLPLSGTWQPVLDPVCGRIVDSVPIAYHAVHGGEDFYFCSVQCEARFKTDRAGYSQRLAVWLRPPVGTG